MNCSNCKKIKSECAKYDLTEINIICRKCKMCKSCRKKNVKTCNICSINCKRCKKKILKNNWPEDIIVNGKCNKCSKLCIKCEKNIPAQKVIYKEEDRYCYDCFDKENRPIENEIKYSYITKKCENGKRFIGWKKTHQKKKCDKCKRIYWQFMNNKKTTCKRCIQRKTSIQDPSDNENKYILIKEKWILDEKKFICNKCFNTVWTKRKNIIGNRKTYRCSNCNPGTDYKKYKYDKKNQKWLLYKQRKECTTCDVKKWLFTKEKGHCKKCIKDGLIKI